MTTTPTRWSTQVTWRIPAGIDRPDLLPRPGETVLTAMAALTRDTRIHGPVLTVDADSRTVTVRAGVDAAAAEEASAIALGLVASALGIEDSLEATAEPYPDEAAMRGMLPS